MTISWKSFPLIPGINKNRRLDSYSAQSWRRANDEEEDVHLQIWGASIDCPASSMPALEAAKCAELQGNEACERFHIALMKAHFEQNRDISEREVLVAVAGEVGLDVAKFTSDLDSGSQIGKVMAEYEEAQEKYPGFGIPTAVFADRHPTVGAVPLSVYKRVIERLLNRQASVQ